MSHQQRENVRQGLVAMLRLRLDACEIASGERIPLVSVFDRAIHGIEKHRAHRLLAILASKAVESPPGFWALCVEPRGVVRSFC
jgi:hypothetical protein